MNKRILSWILALTIVFSIFMQLMPAVNAVSENKNEKNEVVNALNALLVGIRYNPTQQESDVYKWSDKEICDVIYGKLLWDNYEDSDSSYLRKIGLECHTKEDGYWYYDLSLIQKITQDTLNRDFPINHQSEYIYVSGNELCIMPASGESTFLSVQNYTKQGNQIIAVGTAVQNYSAFSEFLGYFQAIFEKKASSTYGYTLVSLCSIEGNRKLRELKASASSELKETTTTHYAKNVLDGDLHTAWVEGVRGVGTNEWIKLETADGSKMDISAIEFSLGYHKNQELLQKNGWPSRVLIECEGGYWQEAEFYNCFMTSVVVLKQPQTTSWIKISILEAASGSKYDDTCISEIRLYGIDTSSYFQEYLEDNPSVNDPVENEDGLILYSDYSNLSIRKGSTITFAAGILTDGERVADVSGINFQIEDTSILKMTITDTKDNYRYVKFKGLAEGTTKVAFTDSGTGHAAQVSITVYDDHYLLYTLNSVPTQKIDKYPTNIYNANGLYIDSYQYIVNADQSATVSFDVYNTNYTYGAVEVYDENGNIKDAVLIEKMTSSNTSIKEALWDNIGYLVRDIIDGDVLSYRQESGYSKRTDISVIIPKNGYIKITNDPENSLLVGFVNSVDGLMSMASLAGDIKEFSFNSVEFAKKLTKELVNNQIYAELIVDGSDFSKKLWKNVTKETFITSESMGSFTDTITKNINELNLGSIIADTAKDFGWEIGEDVFIHFAGPAGTALNVMFIMGKAENLIIQQNDLIQSAGVGSIYIQNQGGGIRACQQIKVESEEFISSDTALNVFTVTLDSEILDAIKNYNPVAYEAMTKGITRTYNISLIKSGEETQPDGKVTVYIPISEDFKTLAYAGELTGKIRIYRVEENGRLTEMDVKIDDGCFVFTTDHFSLYTIVGYDFKAPKLQNEGKSNFPLLIGVISVVAVAVAVVCIVIFKDKKKHI